MKDKSVNENPGSEYEAYKWLRIQFAKRAYLNLRKLYDSYGTLEEMQDYNSEFSMEIWSICYDLEKLLTSPDSPIYDKDGIK
jgi:hypothetical protein